MKKIFSILLIFIILIFLTCCNSNNNNDISIIESNSEISSSVIIPSLDSSKELESSSITITESSINIPSSIIESSNIESSSEEIIDYSNAVFASPTNSGLGTKDDPTSLLSAINKLNNNINTLYLYGGTYYLSSAIILSKMGTSESYYNIQSFNNEKVILDFQKDYRKEQIILGNYNKESAKGIVLKASYYHIKGLTITNCGAHGMQIYGNYNIIEDCIFAYNGNTGCSISSSSSKPKEEWSHDNLILNCTSYGNYDWDRYDNQGEDADGFGAKITSGINNIFDGCISYNNSDDGWDLFTKHATGAIGSVTIRNCIAFNNGYSITGESLKNGNGFKLGGRAIEVDHYVFNCIAFNNKSNGFDDNSNPGTISLKNCTAYNNGSRNYAMGRFLEDINTYNSTWYEGDTLYGPIEGVSKSHNVFENCISYNGSITDSYSGVAENGYFYNTKNKYLTFNLKSNCNSKYQVGTMIDTFMPFESTDIELNDLDNIHYLLRNEDKSINLNSFLKISNDYTFGANLHN